MKRIKRRARPIGVVSGLLIVSAGASQSWAQEGDEVEFDVGRLFFQLNNTDEDLGIHLVVDGEPWKTLEIDDPRDRRIFYVRTQGRLRRQGLTEFKFESAEPNFEEFSAERFFRRFPEGTYDVEGKGLDGTEYESEIEISHLMPAAPDELTVNGIEVPDDCDEEPVPKIAGPFFISWAPVTMSHPEIGTPNGVPISVVRYEVAVERDEPTAIVMDTTIEGPEPLMPAFEVPASVFGPGDLVKFQVLVQGGDDSGAENETSSERCFQVL